MTSSIRFLGAGVLYLLSVTSFAACGGDDNAPADGPGSGLGGAGGQTSATGGSTAGTTNGGLVAAMSLNFLSGGTNCPIAPGYDDFPAVTGGHPVTAAGATATTPNNVESPRGVVTVACGVNTSLLHGGIGFGLSAGISLNYSRTGSGTGNFLFSPPNSSVTYRGTAANPCNITAISTTATGGLYSIACPLLAGDDDATSCVLGESFVYLEGCTLE